MENNFKKYIIFWLSQSISQLGSAMTSFALIIWAYENTSSAMSVSLMSFCNYIPYIIVSLFAGTFVERNSKKKIMMITDLIAAVCSAMVLIASITDTLQIGYIYIINLIIGFMNSFQSPAVTIAIRKMVKEERLAQVSGMNSLASNLIVIFSPFFASMLYSIKGLKGIIAIDLCSFIIAYLILLIIIKIPNDYSNRKNKQSALSGCVEGFKFLRKNKTLWYIIITMAVINFFSRLTYENILSPMILARSGNDTFTLGIVNMTIGIGGIIGGIIVSIKKLKGNKLKIMYMATMFSFLLGDISMGLGRNVIIWSIAGLAASLPIPFIMASQSVLLYKNVPKKIQGRIFAIRNGIQFSTIPIGILIGGFLADYVFEPFMQKNIGLAKILSFAVGNGTGSGMALMFLCTGICGSLFCFYIYTRNEIKDLKN